MKTIIAIGTGYGPFMDGRIVNDALHIVNGRVYHERGHQFAPAIPREQRGNLRPIGPEELARYASGHGGQAVAEWLAENGM